MKAPVTASVSSTVPLLAVLARAKVMVSPSTSVATRFLLSGPLQSVANVRSEIVGASSMGTTVKVKLCVVIKIPSPTVIVMVVSPKR